MKKGIIFLVSLLGIIQIEAQLLPSSTTKLDKLFDKRVEVYFRFFRNDFNKNPQLFLTTVTIDKLDSQYVYAYANRKQMADFLRLNVPFEKQIPPSMQVPKAQLKMKSKTTLSKGVATTWNFYPTYSNYVSIMQQFQANYPSLCRLDTIGFSVQGRILLAAKISDNVSVDEAEPKIFLSSTMHGDEVTGYVLLLHLIDYLLTNYGTNPMVTDIVNNAQLYINPLANPDGTYAGGESTVSGATRYNANGVDLNRNFPVPDGSAGDDGTYAQELETQYFVQYAKKHNFVVGFNLHGGAELANYPWDHTYTDHPDKSWFIYVCKEYADTAQFYSPSGYFDDNNPGSDYPGVIEGATWYVVKGSRQDYSNYNGHCREITLEISSTKTPPASTLEDYWNYNYRSFLNFIKQGMYGIRGIVTDNCSGQPIKALITITSHDADSSQVYSSSLHGDYYRPIIAGTWNMTVSAPGYQTATINNISVANKTVVVRNVSLLPNPPVANFVADKTSSCDGIVHFANTGSYPQGSSILWDFGDGTFSTDPNPIHEYAQDGTFTVKLKISPCAGTDSLIRTNYIVVNRPAAPLANGDTICAGQSAYLTANGNQPQWYNAPGGQLLYTGSTWNTPPLSNDTVFYVTDVLNEEFQGGKTDSSGTGGYYTSSTQHGLVFSCSEPVTLKQVTVYASTAGNRTFTLKDSSNNTIWSVTVNIPAGKQDVIINKPIPVGNNFTLYGPASPNLFRNGSQSGPNLPYPYNIGNIISIKHSTASGYELKYYYFFYNWIIEKSCQSNYVEVPVHVNSLPVASFSYTTNGASVQFSNFSEHATSYFWDFGDGTTSNDVHPIHTYNGTGQYVVTLIAQNDCGTDTATQTIDVITTIPSISSNFLVFPNPVTDLLRIPEANAFQKIDIYTYDGRLVYTKVGPFSAQMSIDFSSYPNGLYLVILYSQDEMQKILLQKR